MNTVSDKGTLLISIPPVAETIVTPRLSIGHIQMYAKTEQHITVFGYNVGARILAADKEAPGLIAKINNTVAAIDWSFTRTGVYYMLARGVLYTVVEVLDVPAFDYFYKAIATLLLPTHESLITAFRGMSGILVPHVTMYTSDSEGLAGIGIDSSEQLDRGIAAATLRSYLPVGKMHAWPLPKQAIELSLHKL